MKNNLVFNSNVSQTTILILFVFFYVVLTNDFANYFPGVNGDILLRQTDTGKT